MKLMEEFYSKESANCYDIMFNFLYTHTHPHTQNTNFLKLPAKAMILTTPPLSSSWLMILNCSSVSLRFSVRDLKSAKLHASKCTSFYGSELQPGQNNTGRKCNNFHADS